MEEGPECLLANPNHPVVSTHQRPNSAEAIHGANQISRSSRRGGLQGGSWVAKWMAAAIEVVLSARHCPPVRKNLDPSSNSTFDRVMSSNTHTHRNLSTTHEMLQGVRNDFSEPKGFSLFNSGRATRARRYAAEGPSAAQFFQLDEVDDTFKVEKALRSICPLAACMPSSTLPRRWAERRTSSCMADLKKGAPLRLTLDIAPWVCSSDFEAARRANVDEPDRGYDDDETDLLASVERWTFSFMPRSSVPNGPLSTSEIFRNFCLALRSIHDTSHTLPSFEAAVSRGTYFPAPTTATENVYGEAIRDSRLLAFRLLEEKVATGGEDHPEMLPHRYRSRRHRASSSPANLLLTNSPVFLRRMAILAARETAAAKSRPTDPTRHPTSTHSDDNTRRLSGRSTLRQSSLDRPSTTPRPSIHCDLTNSGKDCGGVRTRKNDVDGDMSGFDAGMAEEVVGMDTASTAFLSVGTSSCISSARGSSSLLSDESGLRLQESYPEGGAVTDGTRVGDTDRGGGIQSTGSIHVGLVCGIKRAGVGVEGCGEGGVGGIHNAHDMNDAVGHSDSNGDEGVVVDDEELMFGARSVRRTAWVERKVVRLPLSSGTLLSVSVCTPDASSSRRATLNGNSGLEGASGNRRVRMVDAYGRYCFKEDADNADDDDDDDNERDGVWSTKLLQREAEAQIVERGTDDNKSLLDLNVHIEPSRRRSGKEDERENDGAADDDDDDDEYYDVGSSAVPGKETPGKDTDGTTTNEVTESSDDFSAADQVMRYRERNAFIIDSDKETKSGAKGIVPPGSTTEYKHVQDEEYDAGVEIYSEDNAEEAASVDGPQIRDRSVGRRIPLLQRRVIGMSMPIDIAGGAIGEGQHEDDSDAARCGDGAEKDVSIRGEREAPSLHGDMSAEGASGCSCLDAEVEEEFQAPLADIVAKCCEQAALFRTKAKLVARSGAWEQLDGAARGLDEALQLWDLGGWCAF